VGINPYGIAFDSSNGNLYVANSGSTIVSVISGKTNTVIGNPIPAGTGPAGIAFDSSNGNLYVTNFANFVIGAGTVSVISGSSNTVIGNPIPVGTGPLDIAFDSSNGNLYVTNFGSSSGQGGSTVSVISDKTNTVIGNPIPVGTEPVGIAFDSANGNLYVANQGMPFHSSTVSVISGTTNQVIGSPIAVGSLPEFIAFDSSNRNLYVTNTGDDAVSVISGQTNTVIGNPIPVGHNPFGIAFDSANGNLYVANSNAGNSEGNTISVIATAASQLPHTTITSVIDDNGAAIKNGGTTLSTSIHITFTGQAGTNPIASFQCSLDGSKFSACTSPFIANNLAAGKEHNFQVRAIDSLGNKDPTPPKFSWTILTPAQGIEQLTQLIKSMGLDHGTQTALIAHLNAALQFISHKHNLGACIQLDGFTKQVQVGVLVHKISTADALQLIQAAHDVQTALGCNQ
jgi:YVTN family beta-propeller protein